MRNSTRRELAKLREIASLLLYGKRCYFCRLSLISEEFYKTNKCKHGNSDCSPLKDVIEITIHHKDHNHDNDEHSNKALAHARCHKSYHLKMQWRDKKFRKTVLAKRKVA